MRSLTDRKAFVAGLPWVAKLTKPKTCDGIKWGTVAMKDIYPSGPRANLVPARGIQEKSHCKNKGWWRFRALRLRGAWDHQAKSGTYCWSHLVQQSYSNEQETNRIEKAWEDYRNG